MSQVGDGARDVVLRAVDRRARRPSRWSTRSRAWPRASPTASTCCASSTTRRRSTATRPSRTWCCCATRRTSRSSARRRSTVIGPGQEAPRAAARGMAGLAGARRRGAAPAGGPPRTTVEHARRARSCASLVAGRRDHRKTDPAKVTPPNRASITLLAEEGERTCLLTGDAAEEEILEGLEAAGRIERRPLLVQRRQGPAPRLGVQPQPGVRRDRPRRPYVFCADGATRTRTRRWSRPSPRRAATDPRPFTALVQHLRRSAQPRAAARPWRGDRGGRKAAEREHPRSRSGCSMRQASRPPRDRQSEEAP